MTRFPTRCSSRWKPRTTRWPTCFDGAYTAAAADVCITSCHNRVTTPEKVGRWRPSLRCSELLKNPQVTFVGYKVPHPLENRFVLRLQTREGAVPKLVLEDAITSLIAQIDKLDRSATVRAASMDVCGTADS